MSARELANLSLWNYWATDSPGTGSSFFEPAKTRKTACSQCLVLVPSKELLYFDEGLAVCASCNTKLQTVLNAGEGVDEKDEESEKDQKDQKDHKDHKDQKSDKDEKADIPKHPKPLNGLCDLCGGKPLKWHERREDLVDFWLCGACAYISSDLFLDMLKNPTKRPREDGKDEKEGEVVESPAKKQRTA